MIRKIIYNLFIILFFSIILLFSILTTIGIETDKFNKLITNEIAETRNIDLQLNTINFKLDLEELSLFIETQNPKIYYINQKIPTSNIKVYIDFLSLLKTDLKINKINISLEEINYTQINNFSEFIKPSNFKNFLNNKIKEVKLVSDVEFFLDNNGEIENYIFRGKVTDFKANLFKDIILSNTNLSFFADKEDILIKNIFGKIDNIKINNGDIKLNLENGIKLNSNFLSNINLDGETTQKFNKVLQRFKLKGNFKELNGDFSNNILINLDKTYKITNYNYNLSGKVKSKIELIQLLKIILIPKKSKKFFFQMPKLI